MVTTASKGKQSAADARDTPLDVLGRMAVSCPNKAVLIEPHRQWTYTDLYQDVLQTARFLTEHGIKPGHRVILASAEYGNFFRTMFALWAAGASAVPLNLSLPSAQRRLVIDKCHPHALLLGEKELDLEEWAGPTLVASDARHHQADFEPVNLPSEQDAMIMFTSGTTGVPKGVPNSHRALAMNARLTAEALSLSDRDRLLINTPAYYTSAIIHFLTVLAVGGSLVVHKGFFFGSSLLDLVSQHGCTGFGGAPTHFARIFDTLEPGGIKPETLRFMMSSGDHLPVHRIQRAQDIFPDLDIYCVYGLSEVAGRLCILSCNELSGKMGSVGKPLPGMSVSVRRESDMKELPPGEVGEVFVRGPMLMKAYFDSAAGSSEITQEGFRTGDFGYLDDDGYLFLQGRKDDIFKSGGEKVSAAMIQSTLLSVEGFADVAVIPIEDDVMGKIPVAFYVPTDEFVLERTTLVKKLQNMLPRTHIPKRFVKIARIPRTGSGKVIRGELMKFFRLEASLRG